MDLIPLVAMVVVASGVAAIEAGIVRNRRRMQRLSVWNDAARASGATVLDSRWLEGRLVMNGMWGKLHFQIEALRRNHVRVVVGGSEHVLPGISIRPENVRTALAKLRPAGREIEIGADAFDAAFYIGGTPAQVHALLDAATRRDLLDLSADGPLEIRSGEIRLELHVYGLYRAMRVLRCCAERMSGPLDLADLAKHLAANVCCDPEKRVRMLNLLMLVREVRGLEVTEKALRTACSDPDPEIRLRAASELGSAGHATLVALAEGDTDVAARAVCALGRQLGAEKTKALLRRALDADRVDVACACVEILGRFGGAVVLDCLVPLLSNRDTAVAVAAATAIGGTAGPKNEAALLTALDSFDQKLRVAAADALAWAGSVNAIPRLKEAAYSEGDELRRAARQAIAWIQSRIPAGAGPGHLSLAAAEAGQLSLADDTSGRVSLSETDTAATRRS